MQYFFWNHFLPGQPGSSSNSSKSPVNLPEYTHQVNPRSRSLRLRFDRQGQLVVSTPPYVNKATVEAFVASHQDWIIKHQGKVQQKKQTFESETSLSLFGITYHKKILVDTTQASHVSIEGNTIFVKINSSNQTTLKDKSRAVIKAFLIRTAESYLRPRVEDFAKLMKTSYVSLRLKEQSTRWGSCSSQGNLNFNWRLVHMPPEIIDYVIVHELAHRTHMDHSARFWSLVGEFDPEWQKHRGWLKRNGLSVG